ncbi:inhibitor of growth protein 5 isoform X1 [Tachypleus tridentatus]|uniref:inhibitor of growth protein 5 isoform X1 n=1 Tax=Tachypleus tridentatus TaxID=6853 RepID=UPI003FD0CF31
MATAVYLEHYLDSLETLPLELQRNFTLMRELDTKAQELLKNIDIIAEEYLKNVRNLSPEQKTHHMEKIQKLFEKTKEYGDDKVQLAMQTYEMVDKHIRRLDADLARFEADLKDKALSMQSSDSESSQKKKGRKSKEKCEKKKARLRGTSSDEDIPKSARKKLKGQVPLPEPVPVPALGITHPSDVLDMPVDPNEPTYCLCHQVSYGEMIGCDNPDCPIEWFHFACVGLTSKPKGKWYCPKCSSDRKKK